MEVVECEICHKQNRIERHSFAEKYPIPAGWIVLFAYGCQLDDFYFCSPFCAIRYLESLLPH